MDSLLAFAVLGVYVGFCCMVGRLAERSYFRSFWGWTILAASFSPLVALIFLIVADVPQGAAPQVGASERTEVERHEQAAGMTCPACGLTVNPITREGVRSTEAEPWRILCAGCGAEIDVRQSL